MSPRRKIRARDILRDFLTGMTEPELVNKYRLSSDALEKVRRHILQNGGVRATEVAGDIRHGLTDFELMAKYELLPAELEKVLKDLVDVGAIRGEELGERSPFLDHPTNRMLTRRWARTYVRIWLPIYDSVTQAMRGLVRDLSDNGFRVASLRSDIGKGSQFLIRAELVGEVESFEFEATCRWSKTKEKERTTNYLAGFEVTKIGDGALRELRKLVEFLKEGP